MSKILIVYSSTDGHTKKICSQLVAIQEENNNEVELIRVNEANLDKLEAADKIIIGASIRYGKHSKTIYEFINKYQKVLESKSNAFFSVNVVARKPGKNTVETNPYLKRFLTQISWKPKNLTVFAGKIDYQKYNFIDRNVIRLIMWMTKGPTDPLTNIDFTDWEQVKIFGQSIHKM